MPSTPATVSWPRTLPLWPALEEEGITFIGPASEVITLLGDKIEARAAMEAAGLPTAKGSSEPIASADVASALADEIGYPVIIKAAAGGGGIGMQIVEKADEFEGALKLCQSRAKSAFGDERVFVEKYIQGAQHVEFQVLADGKKAFTLANASVQFSGDTRNLSKKDRG